MADENIKHLFGAYQAPSPRYSGFTTQSFYLTMRDDVRLAVDIHLPEGMQPGKKVPALLEQTRYWRAMELRAPFKWFIKAEDLNLRYKDFKPFFTGQGYALVLVDVRGTGASFGVWPYPWHPETISDSYEIVDWIVSQPWSNGRVGAYGISYLGATAELLPVCGHPAVKAVIPMFNHPDAFSDIAFPGGCFNERFIRDWDDLDSNLDRNKVPVELGRVAQLLVKGVKPVAGQENVLEEAISEHANNGRVYKAGLEINYRDQVSPSLEASFEDILVQKHWPDLRDSGSVIFGWGSWMDAGTADAVIRRFLTLENACMGVIGAWEHGGQMNASPYKPPEEPANPPVITQWAEMVRFFDRFLKDGQEEIAQSDKVLYYYTMGEEKWKRTSDWPPPGAIYQRWYLVEDHALSVEYPVNDAGADNLKVDFEASSGEFNRWWEIGALLQKTVVYNERRQAEKHMLVYHSEPMEKDTEISGYPLINLYISSSETDGSFYVYLEDVDEDGNVFYVTEGLLRAVHRKISPESMLDKMQVPHHSYKQDDALALVPGEVAELQFGMLPTSVLIRKGHRLRLGIAGNDNGTFKRIPESGVPLINVERNRRWSSYIELPVIDR